jgi:hypothetical protein
MPGLSGASRLSIPGGHAIALSALVKFFFYWIARTSRAMTDRNGPNFNLTAGWVELRETHRVMNVPFIYDIHADPDFGL